VRHVLDAIRVRQRWLNSSGPLAEAQRLSRLGRFPDIACSGGRIWLETYGPSSALSSARLDAMPPNARMIRDQFFRVSLEDP